MNDSISCKLTPGTFITLLTAERQRARAESRQQGLCATQSGSLATLITCSDKRGKILCTQLINGFALLNCSQAEQSRVLQMLCLYEGQRVHHFS